MCLRHKDLQDADDESLQVGEDWMPLGFSSNAKVIGARMVFAGYGISASELNHDDYATAKAKDKVAVILSGTPDGDNPHGQFARYDDVRWKAVAARNAGAAALLVIAKQENFKDDRARTTALRPWWRCGFAGRVDISADWQRNFFKPMTTGLTQLKQSASTAQISLRSLT